MLVMGELDTWITSREPLVVPRNFKTHGENAMQKLQHILENRRIKIHPPITNLSYHLGRHS
jgi:hypothetical protein